MNRNARRIAWSALVGCALLTQPAFAQSTAPVPGAGSIQPSEGPLAPVPSPSPAAVMDCFIAPARLSDEVIAAFLGQPAALLQRHPAGGLPLASETRMLAGSRSDTVPVLIALAQTAPPDQQAAIGAGLARAALACAGTNVVYAAFIQQSVAESNLSALVTAFAASSNDVQTAALPGAAAIGGVGGAAGGLGGNGSAGGGTAQVGTSTTVGQGTGTGSSGGTGSYYNNGDDTSPTD